MFNDVFMQMAFAQAQKAIKKDEVPVGCVISKNNKVLAVAYNKREHGSGVDHAEIIAIKKACKKIKDFRLEECDLYVTLEPCLMCCGAIVNSRIKNCYFGAYDKKAGFTKQLQDMFVDKRLNHKVNIEGGFLEAQCSQLLKDFFRDKRSIK